MDSGTSSIQPAQPEDFSGKGKKRFGKATVLIACVGAACALALLLMIGGIGGYYLHNKHYYDMADTAVKSQDYDIAIGDLSKVLNIFRDSPKLMQYAQAGQALNEKNFYGAEKLYEGLEGYRDSKAMITKVDYRQAQSLLAQNDYDGARTLFDSLGEYKDSRQMAMEAEYQKASHLLSQGVFHLAKDLFTALGDYKDSRQMAVETDYQKALSYLKAGKFADSETCFSSLAQQNYKDSATMLLEAKYQEAQDLNKKGDYGSALLKIEEVGGYKDSELLKNKICCSLYSEGVVSYKTGQYDEARGYFSKVESYDKSRTYLLLITAHGKTQSDANTDVSGMRMIYDQLKDLGAFEDASYLRTSDAFIFFRLEGNWKDEEGNYFNLYYDSAKNGWYVKYKLPYIGGTYFRIRNRELSLGSDDKGWNRNFLFVFLSEDKMQVHCYKNGAAYILTR